MTDRLQHLEDIFPDFAVAGYSPKSEKSGAYNCIAYAAGDGTRKWEGIENWVTIGPKKPRKAIHWML